MIKDLPNWINVVFILTWFTTLVFYYYSNGKAVKSTLLIFAWSIFQSIIAYLGFYQDSRAVPPRYALVLLPAIVIIAYALIYKKEQILISRNLHISSLLHVIRIPVEICLLYLFLNNMIPELMTFEGRNFDILAGITAPIIALLVYKKKISFGLLKAWNIVSICLVSFIVLNALLSTDTVIQLFAFDQPNKAINYFPFVLLPSVIVPIVIYTHLSDLIKIKRLASN